MATGYCRTMFFDTKNEYHNKNHIEYVSGKLVGRDSYRAPMREACANALDSLLYYVSETMPDDDSGRYVFCMRKKELLELIVNSTKVSPTTFYRVLRESYEDLNLSKNHVWGNVMTVWNS